jgi:hypothetical protein
MTSRFYRRLIAEFWQISLQKLKTKKIPFALWTVAVCLDRFELLHHFRTGVSLKPATLPTNTGHRKPNVTDFNATCALFSKETLQDGGQGHCWCHHASRGRAVGPALHLSALAHAHVKHAGIDALDCAL